MRENDARRLPGEQLLQAGARGIAVGKSGAHIYRRFAVRVAVARQFHHQLPEAAAHLRSLNILNEIGENQGAARMMEKVDFVHDAAATE